MYDHVLYAAERARSASGFIMYDTNTYRYWLLIMIMILKTSVCALL